MRYLILFSILMLSLSTLFADPIPDFKLPDLNNQQVPVSELLGKGPILIDFWASWCAPCKTSMPYLHALAEKYDSLTVVMISIDAAKDISKAKNYLKGKNYKFLPLFDSEKSLAKRLNVSTVPHTFILDKTGEIIYSHVGFSPGMENAYEQIIRKQLGLEPTDLGEVSDCE